MRKVKVLQIGGNTQKNGITTFLLNAYRLMQDDFSFIFINTAFRNSDPEVQQVIEALGGEIYHLPYKKNVSDIEEELKKIIDTDRPDVIHSHYFFSNGDFMRIGHETDIPVRITHCHNDKSAYINDEEKQILLRSRELTQEYATVKLAVSKNAGIFYYGDDKFTVCHAAIEDDKYYPIPEKAELLKKHKLDDRFNYSLFVGRFAFQKNVGFLIDVIKELPDRKLILVGHGKKKESFEEKIEAEGISDKFIFKTDEYLNELYNVSDSLLLPSFYEGLGLVLAEAQYAGIPCFASNKISDEADLGMVEFLPLDTSVWVTRLKILKKNECPVKIDTTKFDANSIANQLKNYYTVNNNLSDAYIYLAKEYMLGSTERFGNRKRVVENLKQAHELGNIRGSFYYALQFFEGSGVDKNIEYAGSIVKEISATIESYAKSEYADYILIMADMYSFGLGKKQSFELAMKYYLKAAELGNLEAMCDLGYMYSAGQGTEKNLEKSFYWYKKSAELGYLHSIRDIGQCYYFGLGTSVDYKEAVQWFKKASEQNYSHATCDLALCYLKGHGVEKDFLKAAEAYSLAVKQEKSRAVRDLIAHSIDVDELLQNGKIKFINRETINAVDNNVLTDNTMVINVNIKSIDQSIFYNHANIKKFFVEKDNPYFKAYGGVLYSKNGETLIHFPSGSPVTEFIVPDHVRYIGIYAFQNCRNLQKVILHTGIEIIGDSAFDDCKNLMEIKLPSSINSVGAWAFHACDKLKELFLPAKLSEIGNYAFGSCEKLRKITVNSENQMYTSKDGNLYSKDMKLLLQYAIGKKEKLFVLPPETKTISFRAFSDAYNLEYVDACPVEKIEEKAFYFCSNLKKLLVSANCKISGEKVFEHTTDNFASSFSRRGRIILFADIHGHIRLDFLSEKLKNLKINAEDVIIILGDAGIVWQIPMRDDVREFYSALICDVLFLDGNHENYDILGTLKKVERYGAEVHEVLSNVFHLIRGNAYLINGKKCFVFGGAYSIKRETDSSPVQTWSEELPNAKEYKRGMDTIFENENKFDIILTHQSPKSILDEIAYNYSLNETELLDYLERIRNDVKFDHWYFGHIHKDIKKEKFTGLYNNCEVIE